jgi:hypothetical protein
MLIECSSHQCWAALAVYVSKQQYADCVLHRSSITALKCLLALYHACFYSNQAVPEDAATDSDSDIIIESVTDYSSSEEADELSCNYSAQNSSHMTDVTADVTADVATTAAASIAAASAAADGNGSAGANRKPKGRPPGKRAKQQQQQQPARRRSSASSSAATAAAAAASVPVIDESSSTVVQYSELSPEQEVLLLQCLECHGWPAAADVLTAEHAYRRAKLPAMSSTAVHSLFAAVAAAAATAASAEPAAPQRRGSTAYVRLGGTTKTVHSAQMSMLASITFRALAQRKLQQCAAAGGSIEVAGTELIALLNAANSGESWADGGSWAALRARHWSAELDQRLLQGLFKHGFELHSK